MLPLETKQSGGKLHPTRISRGGDVSRGGITQQEKGHFIGYNIKMHLREVGGGGDWMELAQDRDR